MAETTQAAERDLLELIFDPATDGQTYLNLLYLLLGFPLGIAYFVFLVAGLSTGLSLLIIYIGIPILMGVLLASRGLGAFERSLARGMLHVNIAPPLSLPPGVGILGNLKGLLTSSATWKALAYLALRFPFGIAVFSVLVTAFSLSFELILAPLLYRTLPIEFAIWRVHTGDEAMVWCMIGIVLLMASFHLVNGLAYLWGRFAQTMLGPDSTAGR